MLRAASFSLHLLKQLNNSDAENQAILFILKISLTSFVFSGMLFLLYPVWFETLFFKPEKPEIMKQVFTLLSLAVIMVSCKSKVETTDQTKVLSAVDSAEFAAFQEWKEERDMKKMQAATTVRYVERKQPTAAPVVYNNTTPAKKKWSHATKGAVIGGASGAVIGGVVSKKNRVAGVLVGGVLGAGGGYAIGRSIDKKQGN